MAVVQRRAAGREVDEGAGVAGGWLLEPLAVAPLAPVVILRIPAAGLVPAGAQLDVVPRGNVVLAFELRMVEGGVRRLQGPNGDKNDG